MISISSIIRHSIIGLANEICGGRRIATNAWQIQIKVSDNLLISCEEARLGTTNIAIIYILRDRVTLIDYRRSSPYYGKRDLYFADPDFYTTTKEFLKVAGTRSGEAVK